MTYAPMKPIKRLIYNLKKTWVYNFVVVFLTEKLTYLEIRVLLFEQPCSLTSIFTVSQVGGDDHLSPLAHTHPPQAFIQPLDHFVGSQSRNGSGLIMVPGR